MKLECLLSHCIIAPMLALDPALPANVSLKELPTLAPSLVAAKELLLMSKPSHPSTTASVVVFHSQADGKYTHTHAKKGKEENTSWIMRTDNFFSKRWRRETAWK